MAKTELTITIDERLAATVKRVATETRQQESDVIERALRAYFGLQNTIDRIRTRLGDDGLDEEEADEFGVAEVKAYRAEQEGKR